MSIADGELTSLALCWRLERSDGAGIALTSHDQALTRDQIAYAPSPGMMPASIKRSLGLEPDSTEVAGALSSDALDEQDLALGRWDGATMQLTAMDWANAEADPIALLAGEVGTVTVDGEGFTADLQGAAAKLDNPLLSRNLAGMSRHVRRQEMPGRSRGTNDHCKGDRGRRSDADAGYQR
jgi:uncharacterized phage protein (TIGR02218 family)